MADGALQGQHSGCLRKSELKFDTWIVQNVESLYHVAQQMQRQEQLEKLEFNGMEANDGLQEQPVCFIYYLLHCRCSDLTVIF